MRNSFFATGNFTQLEEDLMQPLLEIDNLVGGYSNKNVLHKISFQVGSEEIVGLIGLNGAG